MRSTYPLWICVFVVSAALAACGGGAPGEEAGAADAADAGLDSTGGESDAGVTDTGPGGDTGASSDADGGGDDDTSDGTSDDADTAETSCEAACEVDDTRCVGGAIQRCAPDEDGCPIWTAGTPCPADAPLCDESTGEPRCIGLEDPRCDDGEANGDETDVDCGGSCGPCALGSACGGAEDCASGVCGEGVCLREACENGEQDLDESDVDCGGSCAP